MFCDVKYCVVLLKKHAHFLVIGQGFKLCFSECTLDTFVVSESNMGPVMLVARQHSTHHLNACWHLAWINEEFNAHNYLPF